ncbi:hypothetical protein [Rhodoflexus caldus]|uniref:hypothetical protein n=1 Tax=Rhodoflexus caldus TaxID=2891236 RepID=UPI00202A362B|nr:hypothetical protein [Rhodoflexus caldus]
MPLKINIAPDGAPALRELTAEKTQKNHQDGFLMAWVHGFVARAGRIKMASHLCLPTFFADSEQNVHPNQSYTALAG